MLVVFSHGKESGPWGSKIKALAGVAGEMGCRVESLDYQGMDDPAARVDKLVAFCRSQDGPILLAGSSMGGYVSVAAAARVKPAGLFLLAPAVDLPGYTDVDPAAIGCPVTIVHGWRDSVIPPENSVFFAKGIRATLHLVDGDHRLRENIEDVKVHFRRFLETAGVRAGSLTAGGT